MSDWAVGDLAVCVNNRRIPDIGAADAGYALREGRTYCVEGQWSDPLDGVDLLLLGGVRSRDPDASGAFAASRFRKIDKHEACETEFVTLLQRIKRKQVA